MFKKELKNNLKLFLIVLGVLIGTFMMAYIVYPFAMDEETVKSLDEMMKMFPEELLKAFNMDNVSIATPFGWVKSEGFMLALLGIAIYASILGGTVVLKEENNKTIEYLAVLPVKRSKIITMKILAAWIYIVGIVVAFTIFNLLALLILGGDFDIAQFFLLSFSPLLLAVPFFFINLFISTLFRKNMKTIGISLGLVFISYFINLVSQMSDKIEFFKYFSLYTLSDTRNIITNTNVSIVCIIVSIVIGAIFAVASYIRYNKKELL